MEHQIVITIMEIGCLDSGEIEIQTVLIPKDPLTITMAGQISKQIIAAYVAKPPMWRQMVAQIWSQTLV